MGAGEVEFTSLANGNTTSTKNDDGFDGLGSVFTDLETPDFFNELLEEEFGILRAATSFRVELNGEEWLGFVTDTFVRAVIDVGEVGFPAFREILNVSDETVVLRSNVDATSKVINTRLILTTITILHFVGGATTSVGENLVTHADTEDGLFARQCPPNVLDGVLVESRVTRAVTDEDTVIFLFSLFIENSVVRSESEGDVVFEEAADGVELATHVEAENTETAMSVGDTLGGGDFLNEIPFVRIVERNVVES